MKMIYQIYYVNIIVDWSKLCFPWLSRRFYCLQNKCFNLISAENLICLSSTWLTLNSRRVTIRLLGLSFSPDMKWKYYIE